VSQTWQEKRAADFGRAERIALAAIGDDDEWKLPRKLRLKMFLFRVTAPFRDAAIAALRSCGLLKDSPPVQLGASLSTDPSTTSLPTPATAKPSTRSARYRAAPPEPKTSSSST
jgi:hypothetical protein